MAFFFLAAIERHAERAAMRSQVPIATYGEALPDGTVLELVRDPASGELRLLIWDGLTASVAPRFELNGHIYVPATLDPTVMRAVRLPERVDRYARLAIPAPRVERVIETQPAGEVVQERVVMRQRPTFRLLPVLGRKGGQRTERKEEIKESRVERG